MQAEKNKVEAVLFTTGRFLSIEEIGKMAGIGSIGILKDLLQELKKDYTQKDSALEIIDQGEKWKLNLKKDYLYVSESLLSDCELDRPTQETLAIIAYKNPIFQNDLVKIRGTTAYDHVKLLKELDFVVSEPSGRTRILKVTNKFYDYFDVVEDQLKTKFAALPQEQQTLALDPPQQEQPPEEDHEHQTP